MFCASSRAASESCQLLIALELADESKANGELGKRKFQFLPKSLGVAKPYRFKGVLPWA